MTRRPEDVTLGGTAGLVMFATSAAVAVIIYAVFRFVAALPASVVTDGLTRLTN